jgi:hypothetical protein
MNVTRKEIPHPRFIHTIELSDSEVELLYEALSVWWPGRYGTGTDIHKFVTELMNELRP